MSSTNYRISKEAIKDLNSIWTYTYQKWSKTQADSYYQAIVNEFQYISDNFFIGKSVENIRKNYRVLKVKSHLIFYRKVENDTIEIVKILHQQMDSKKNYDKPIGFTSNTE